MQIKGFTGASVLLVALLGGAAGGALVAGGHDTAPPAVSFDQTAQNTVKTNQAKRAEAAAKKAEKAAKRAEAAAVRAESAMTQDTGRMTTPAPENPVEGGPCYTEGLATTSSSHPKLVCQNGVWTKVEPDPEPTPAP